MTTMRATKLLPAGYEPAQVINLNNRRMILTLNAVGLGLLAAFAWFFLRMAALLRSDFRGASIAGTMDNLDFVGFFLTIIVTMALHELAHGAFFWYFTRSRPEFGVNLLYAYAAAPGWYFPRTQFALVGIAPFAILTVAGLALLPFVPFEWVPRLLLGLTINAAGAVGDFYVVALLINQPEDTYVQDMGPNMLLYENRRPLRLAAWQQLLARFGVPAAKAETAFHALARQYETGERYYHTLQHALQVLQVSESLIHEASDPDAVRLAAWLHDAVYDPRRDDNEEQSARLAGEMLRDLGVPAGTVAEVERLIRLTADYAKPTWEQADREDANAHVLLDADLAGLGSSEDNFRSTGAAIREEFNWVPRDQYNASRAWFLRRLLERERIYYTGQMYAQYEQAARRNLRNELARLNGHHKAAA